ncbi:hypothetical protein D7234_15690, partial [Legionella pneumophila]
MTSGKEESTLASQRLSKVKYSLDMAKLIIACNNKKTIFGDIKDQQNIELVKLIKNNDVEKLAYWLHFNSFVKYQLKKVIKSDAVEIGNPSTDLINKVNSILLNYLKEQQIKVKLDKYVASDFSTKDYLRLHEIAESFKRMTLGSSPVKSNDVLPLLNAKNRRLNALGRSQNFVAVSCANYASQSTVRKLAKNIKNLKKGERKQYVYYHFNENHAIGFDVEKDSNGVYKIFCFESAGDFKHYEALDLLYKDLSSLGLKFELKSCRSQLQKDQYNCSIFTMSALSELGKYEHVFDYLPEQYEEDQEPKHTKEVKIPVSLIQERVVKLDAMDKIGWIKLADMPTKIIAMNQSYHAMEASLKQSKDFDLDPATFCGLHKEKYHFEPNKAESTKYIDRRRKNIFQRVTLSIKTIEQEAYLEFLKNLPLLASINNGEVPDFKKEITDNKSMSLDEKLAYIEKLFFVIAEEKKIRRFSSSNDLKNMQPYYLKSLLLLRNEYLRLLSLKPREDYEKYFQNSEDSKSLLGYQLESACRELSIVGIESLQSVFKECFPKDFVIEYYHQNNYYEDLKIKNPIMEFFTKTTILDASKVSKELAVFEKEYGNGSDSSLFITTKILDFMNGAIRSCVFHEHSTSLIKAASGIEPDALLKSISSLPSVSNAYIFTDDGKFYFYHKENTPQLKEIVLDQQRLQKIIEIAKKEIKCTGYNPEEQFSLGNETVKEVSSFFRRPALNQISLLVECAPYSNKEKVKIYNIMEVREIYLQYLSKLLSKDKMLAAKHWNEWKKYLLDSLDVMKKDYPISQPVQDVIRKLDEAEKEFLTSSGQNNQSIQSKMQIALTRVIEKTHSFFKSKTLKDIITDYYYKEPEEVSDYGDSRPYANENHDNLNFKLKMFHVQDPKNTRWIEYERCKPPVVRNNELDWKFNLSIHKDDLPKAFPIIAELA